MKVLSEKGGSSFKGVKMILCENPLPPIKQAIESAKNILPESNYYTEAYSAPLRDLLASQLNISNSMIHINAGSELILRQLFQKFGQRVHLLTPTYSLFTEIAQSYTETRMLPGNNFQYNLSALKVPQGTSLMVIVNPNNPNGGTFDMTPLPQLLNDHPETIFLVDEAFISVAGTTVAHLVSKNKNLLVTRTFSKAHSLAGFRIGYGIFPEPIAEYFNLHNDAYPLARPSEAAAITTLQHQNLIYDRVTQLKQWTTDLSINLQKLNIRTYPTSTYFFLADFSPNSAKFIADAMVKKGFLLRPLNDPVLGKGMMRITTSTPENNRQFIKALNDILKTR